MTRAWWRGVFGRLAAALVVGVAALGAAGCHSYHYYDIDVQYGASFTLTSSGNVQLGLLNVSGADSGQLDLPMSILAGNQFRDLGTFEYATFADSGTLTFTVDLYNGSTATTNCLYGTGSTPLAASGDTTQKGTVTVERTATNGCANNQPDAGQ